MSRIKILWDRRDLLRAYVARDLHDRHAGQALGFLWAFGVPIFLMLIYVALFTVVFSTRYQVEGGPSSYMPSILAGLLAWLPVQDVLARSTSVLPVNSALVKQVAFPTEVLPVKVSIATLVPYVGALLIAVGVSLWNSTLSFATLLLPLVIAFQALFMVGLSLILSVAGLIVRDLREVVTVFASLNLFLTPILYPPGQIPEILQPVVAINPFSYLVLCWQQVLFKSSDTSFLDWSIMASISIVTLAVGWLLFQRVRTSIGDAL